MSTAAVPACSLILSTHNSPRFLEFVFAGLARQTRTDFEVLIADDGSREATRDFLRAARPHLPFRLRHVRQEHKGYYGKMSIVNRAITHADADYLILADGDVIPREDYVATHLSMRRRNCFLAGGDFRLSPAATQALTLDDVRTGRAFSYAFLRSIGQEKTRRRVKLWRLPWLTRLLDAVNFSPARWSGSNASAWKADLLRVNGFDETIHAPGKDDTELGHRLWNAGVQSVHARHNTIALHLFHGWGNYTDHGRQRNREILEETKRTRRTLARQGITQIDPADHTVEG